MRVYYTVLQNSLELISNIQTTRDTLTTLTSSLPICQFCAGTIKRSFAIWKPIRIIITMSMVISGHHVWQEIQSEISRLCSTMCPSSLQGPQPHSFPASRPLIFLSSLCDSACPVRRYDCIGVAVIKNMNISFIILTWNSEKYINKCLTSIFTDLLNSNYTYEIFLVDNGRPLQNATFFCQARKAKILTGGIHWVFRG